MSRLNRILRVYLVGAALIGRRDYCWRERVDDLLLCVPNMRWAILVLDGPFRAVVRLHFDCFENLLRVLTINIEELGFSNRGVFTLLSVTLELGDSLVLQRLFRDIGLAAQGPEIDLLEFGVVLVCVDFQVLGLLGLHSVLDLIDILQCEARLIAESQSLVLLRIVHEHEDFLLAHARDLDGLLEEAASPLAKCHVASRLVGDQLRFVHCASAHMVIL